MKTKNKWFDCANRSPERCRKAGMRACFPSTPGVLMMMAAVASGAVDASNCVNGTDAAARASDPVETVVLDVTVSTTTLVAEPDWLDVLEARVREADRLGLFARETQSARIRMAQHAEHPVRLPLPRASKASTHSVMLLQENQWLEMTDVQRQALEKLQRAYLFVDAADAVQLAWLKTEWPRLRQARTGSIPVRVVAVGGSLVDLTRAAGARVWADQGGRLTRTFALNAVPALAVIESRKNSDGESAGFACTVTAFVVRDADKDSGASISSGIPEEAL